MGYDKIGDGVAKILTVVAVVFVIVSLSITTGSVYIMYLILNWLFN